MLILIPNSNLGLTLHPCLRKRARRWLQDTSKRKLADFLIFLAPPSFCFPGLTRG